MTSRKSQLFPCQQGIWAGSSEIGLLLDDFNLRIVPYRNDGDAYKLSVPGIPPHLAEEAINLWGRNNGPDSFIHGVASTLLTEHEVWLEIAFETDERNRCPFRVFLVHGVRKTESGKLIQQVPEFDESGYEFVGTVTGESNQIELEPERMVHVSLPSQYPSQLLTKIAKDLIEVDATFSLMPAWVEEQMSGQRRDVPRYDFNEATRTERLRIAQAALPIGWSAREILYANYRHLGEYYINWRELKFLHFRASMREQAEDALRRVLTIAGAKCGFEASAKAYGLLIPTEVETVIHKYEAGEIPFSQLRTIILESPDNPFAKERTLF